jgi:hypothetical protein
MTALTRQGHPLAALSAFAPARPRSAHTWLLAPAPFPVRPAILLVWPCWAKKVGLTPPGSDCQPCRKRIFLLVYSSLRLVPGEGNQHRLR